MLNQFVCVGRVVDQPKKITTKDGFIDGFVLKLSIPKSYKCNEGVYETENIEFIVNGNAADSCLELMKQGDIAGIKGHLEVNEYSIIVAIADKITHLSNEIAEEKEAK